MVFSSRLISSIAAATVVLVAGAATAGAQIVNGSFEAPVQGGQFGQVNAPGAIGGWTVASGSVDLINSYWPAYAGSQSLDLSGLAAGSIYQDFTLSQAGSYNLFFAMAANPDGGARTVSMEVSFGLSGGSMSSSLFTFDGSNSTKENMGWQMKNMLVNVAEAGSYRLQFTSLENNAMGPALDAVSISAVSSVPEPASVALLGTGLLALGGIGLRRSRNRA